MDPSNSVIVIESPNKAAKFKHCTGAKIIATVGHFKDIPAASLGVDLKTYMPTFRISPGRSSIVNELRKCQGKEVYIATDPDREGFAIATHVYSVVRALAKKIYRVEVREITEKGIREALAAAVPFEKANMGVFDAFLGRRVGDRLIGYMLSPDVSNSLKAVYTVGRVQSPGLRLVVDREMDIEKFKTTPYYQIRLKLCKSKQEFNALHENGNIKDWKTAETLKNKIDAVKGVAKVLAIEKQLILRPPKGPFTTATLQQAACNRLKLTTDKTMELAQGLFEKGLITYHRTDSQRLSIEFIQEIQSHVKAEYGARYCPDQPLNYKSKNSQSEAHEGIRQTVVHKMEEIPGKIKNSGLGSEHEELYKLICSRTMACQMTKAEYEIETINIEYGGEIFKASGTLQKYDGWAKLYEDITVNDEGDNKSLPGMTQGENIEVKGIEMLERETKPPRRYTEATLVKELDRRGIGRPSTYATILKGLKGRRYLIIEKGSLVPTNEGRSLVACLKEKHPWVIDYNLTKSMEEYLDKVQENRANWRDFAKSLHKQIGFAEPPAWKVSKTKIGGKGNGKRAS